MGEILAAIPAHNEAKTIGSVVLSAMQYVDEVAVIDDGSTDGTAWIAERAGATVIRHDGNQGYGAAIRSCFDYARTNGTQVLVILDGDGQHRPEAIPRVVKPVRDGRADISIGSRFLKPESLSKVPRYRRFGIRVLTKLTNSGSRLRARVKDGQSGFRAYSRRAVDALDPRERAMGASAEILWDADRRGLRIVEVPIQVDYDVDGSSQGAVRHGLSVVGSMVRYLETERPVTVFGVICDEGLPRQGDAAPHSPDVTIVIPAKNEARRIERCLAALHAQTLPPKEIIVVDGHSGDATAEIARRLGARVLYEEYGTRSGACEVGVEAAQGEFVAFTDADCIPDPHWLERLAARFAPDISGVGGKIANEGDSFWQKAVDAALDTIVGSANSVQGRMFGAPRYVSSISGCNSMYRRGRPPPPARGRPPLPTPPETPPDPPRVGEGKDPFTPPPRPHPPPPRGRRG